MPTDGHRGGHVRMHRGRKRVERKGQRWVGPQVGHPFRDVEHTPGVQRAPRARTRPGLSFLVTLWKGRGNEGQGRGRERGRSR